LEALQPTAERRRALACSKGVWRQWGGEGQGKDQNVKKGKRGEFAHGVTVPMPAAQSRAGGSAPSRANSHDSRKVLSEARQEVSAEKARGAPLPTSTPQPTCPSAPRACSRQRHTRTFPLAQG